jgi:hypothetical protein
MRAMTTLPHTQNQQQADTEACCASVHDEVARTAYGLYEQRGSQDGHAERNWLDAEAQVKSRHAESMHGTKAAGRQAGPHGR